MRIVLGLGPTLFAANVAHEFRSRGWEAFSTATGEDARRYAVANCTSVVLVPYQDNDPLATAKIVNAMPRKTKVVLLTATSNRRAVQLAEMMGIPVVAEAGGVDAVVAAVAGLLPVIK